VRNKCNRIPSSRIETILIPHSRFINGETIDYNIEKRPVYQLVLKMLDNAFVRLIEGDAPILHSDQGWHYQMSKYQQALKERGIIQSMSLKENCLEITSNGKFLWLIKV
jgi:putative transposase